MKKATYSVTMNSLRTSIKREMLKSSPASARMKLGTMRCTSGVVVRSWRHSDKITLLSSSVVV
jgi:hypothetical protein